MAAAEHSWSGETRAGWQGPNTKHPLEPQRHQKIRFLPGAQREVTVGLVETKNCWTESKTGGRKQPTKQGEIRLQSVHLTQQIWGVLVLCPNKTQLQSSKAPHGHLLVLSSRTSPTTKRAPTQNTRRVSPQPTEGYFHLLTSRMTPKTDRSHRACP